MCFKIASSLQHEFVYPTTVRVCVPLPKIIIGFFGDLIFTKECTYVCMNFYNKEKINLDGWGQILWIKVKSKYQI